MRVYFLGAGASKAIYPGLPTATELTLDDLLDQSRYCNAGDGTDHITPLQFFVNAKEFPPALRKKPIEDVIEYFEDYKEQYLHLSICLLRRLWAPNTGNMNLIRNWLTSIRNRCDVILTTNYDTVVERGMGTFPGRTTVVGGGIAHTTLERSGLIDYGVPREMLISVEKDAPTQQNSLLLLKLHGSISWSYCESCKTARLHPTHRSEAEEALSRDGSCGNCSQPNMRSPVFVAPVKDKSYNQPVIRAVWKSAQEVLEKADEIVFAGFSLSSNDRQIQELLRHGHEIAHTPHISVIDPSASQLVSRYEGIYGAAVEYTLGTDWLEYLRTESPI